MSCWASGSTSKSLFSHETHTPGAPLPNALKPNVCQPQGSLSVRGCARKGQCIRDPWVQSPEGDCCVTCEHGAMKPVSSLRVTWFRAPILSLPQAIPVPWIWSFVYASVSSGWHSISKQILVYFLSACVSQQLDQLSSKMETMLKKLFSHIHLREDSLLILRPLQHLLARAGRTRQKQASQQAWRTQLSDHLVYTNRDLRGTD